MERIGEARQPEPPPSRPPPPHSPYTHSLARSLARAHPPRRTRTSAGATHSAARAAVPQRDGGGAHGAPRRLAGGAACPDWAPTPVDVGPGRCRDHLGRDRRSRAPGSPGFVATGVVSTLAAGSGKPVAGGAGDGAESRRAGAPGRTRAAAPAGRRQKR